MKSLNEYINENMVDNFEPIQNDGYVKVIMLSGDYCDSNLNLISGANSCCLIWLPKNTRFTYVRCNGGVRYLDSHTWYKESDIPLKIKWEETDGIAIDYAYSGQIGNREKPKLKVKYAKVPYEELKKLFKENDKTLHIQVERGYSTARLESIFDDWKDEGIL